MQKNVSPKYFLCYVLCMFIVFSCVQKPVSSIADTGFFLVRGHYLAIKSFLACDFVTLLYC